MFMPRISRYRRSLEFSGTFTCTGDTGARGGHHTIPYTYKTEYLSRLTTVATPLQKKVVQTRRGVAVEGGGGCSTMHSRDSGPPMCVRMK